MFHYVSNMFLCNNICWLLDSCFCCQTPHMSREIYGIIRSCMFKCLNVEMYLYVHSECNSAIVGALLYNEDCCYFPG